MKSFNQFILEGDKQAVKVRIIDTLLHQIEDDFDRFKASNNWKENTIAVSIIAVKVAAIIWIIKTMVSLSESINTFTKNDFDKLGRDIKYARKKIDELKRKKISDIYIDRIYAKDLVSQYNLSDDPIAKNEIEKLLHQIYRNEWEESPLRIFKYPFQQKPGDI